MNLSQIKKLIAIVLAITAIGASRAAELRLANGDVLTGEVVSHESGKIKFSSPILGVVEVLDSVASVVTELPAETVATPPAAKVAEVAADSDHASKKRDADRKVTPWKSKIDLGVNWQDGGKNQQDVSVRFESERKVRRSQYRVQARYLYSEIAGVTANERRDAGFRWRRDFDERWFSQSNSTYFQDQLKDIRLDVDQNVGVGYKVLSRDHAIANLGAGVTFQYRETDDLPGAFNPFGELFQDLKWHLNDRVEISQEAGALYSPDGRTFQATASHPDKFSDQPSYKLRFNSVIRGQVTDTVSVNLRYEYEFDNSIIDREARVDQRITTSLGYVF